MPRADPSPRLAEDWWVVAGRLGRGRPDAEPVAAAGGTRGFRAGRPRVFGDSAVGRRWAEPFGNLRSQARRPGRISRTLPADRHERAGHRNLRTNAEPG